MNNKKKAFLILYPEDPYFAAIFSQLLLALSKQYPEHLLIVSPVWAINFYNPLTFHPITFARFLKRSLFYITNQSLLKFKASRSISSFLGEQFPSNLKIIGVAEYLIYTILIRLKPCSYRKYLDTRENFTIENIKVGDLIIDTFLRFKPSPSFQATDSFAIKLLKLSFRYISYFDHLFDSYDISNIFASYTTYVYYGIPLRMAQDRGIYVTTFGGRFTFYKHHTPSTFLSHNLDHTSFSNQPSLRNKLSSNAIEAAKISLENRLHGRQDATIAYMTNFSDSHDDTNIFTDCNVIFLHDFYDSPHIYRSMLHSDFFQWLDDTIKTLTSSGEKIFIKPHPNQSVDSKRYIPELIDSYKDNGLVCWISEKVSNAIILKQMPKLVISVYGSVLVEAAYCGVRSISAGDHPAINFNISYNPTSLSDYREKLTKPFLIAPPSPHDSIIFLAQQKSVYSEGIPTSLINYVGCSWEHLNSNSQILYSTAVTDFICSSISSLLKSHFI